MKNCTKCTRANADCDDYCVYCGSKLPTTVTCSCGYCINTGENFCGKCGMEKAKLEEEEAREAFGNEQEKMLEPELSNPSL